MRSQSIYSRRYSEGSYSVDEIRSDLAPLDRLLSHQGCVTDFRENIPGVREFAIETVEGETVMYMVGETREIAMAVKAMIVTLTLPKPQGG